jgi:hypothetical protein
MVVEVDEETRRYVALVPGKRLRRATKAALGEEILRSYHATSDFVALFSTSRFLSAAARFR